MSKKGRMIYVPKKVLIELENIQSNYDLERRSEAFDKMAEFVPVGIELEKAIMGTGLFNKLSTRIKKKKK